MNYKDEQYKLISESVREQLGIEEEDDSNLDLPLQVISGEIVDLKQQLNIKDITITDLETIIEHLSEKVDLLEKLFFEGSKTSALITCFEYDPPW